MEINNFCTRCGGRVVDGVCANCATASQEITEQATAQSSVQYQQPPMFNMPAQSVYQNNFNNDLYTNKGMFISPDERLLHKVGSGYVQNYLTGSGISKDSAAVTNKRVYYKGKTYASGLGFRKFKTTLVADLKDITCVGIYKSFDIFKLIVSIIMILAGVYIAGQGDNDIMFVSAILIILSIIGFISVILTASTVLKIDYEGGYISLDVKAFGEKELNDFRTALFRAKDAITDYNQK